MATDDAMSSCWYMHASQSALLIMMTQLCQVSCAS